MVEHSKKRDTHALDFDATLIFYTAPLTKDRGGYTFPICEMEMAYDNLKERRGRKTMTQRVAISRVENEDIEAAVRKAVSLAGGLEQIIHHDSRVLVKPNMLQPSPSGHGLVTDARITEAVTKMVLELSPRSIIIGDGAGAGYDFPGHSTEEAFEESGTLDVARKLGVELRNLNRDAFEEVTIEGAHVMDKVRIAKTALESDVIISLAVLKSHIRTKVTLSLKNMKGVMPGAEKRKSHRLGLDLAIVDLNSVVRPNYAVIDATVGMEGLWQYPQDRKELGLVIAGRDPLSADIVGATLMGVDPHQVMHLKYLAQDEGRTVDCEQIEIRGEALEQHQQHFKTGFQAFEERFPGVQVLQGESACTGCTNELVSAITYMKESGYGDRLEDLCIIIGNPIEPKVSGKAAVLGKCAKEFQHLGYYAAGCPPKEEDMIRALCEACAADEKLVIATRDEARRRLWKSSDELLKR
jgi:uncharacterized protein (DUF362 family)